MTAAGAEAPAQPSKAQLSDVAALVTDTSKRIDAWPEAAVRALAPALAAAQAEVADGLRAWLASVPDGNERFTHQRLAGALLQLEGAMQTVRRLAPSVYQELTVFYPPMGADAVNSMTREYARMLDVFGGAQSATKLNLDTARIVSERENLLIPRFESSAMRYAGDVLGDIQGELVKGVLLNETYFEIVDRLVRIGGPRAPTAGVTAEAGEEIADGMFTRYRWWATRLVRTELQHAANLTLDDGIRKLAEFTPGLMRRWDASLDSRICGLCFDLHGTTAPIGGEFADGVDTAPAHPCCRCRVGAWRPEWAPYLDWMKEIQ